MSQSQILTVYESEGLGRFGLAWRIGSNSATDLFCERGLMLLPIGRAEERARATSIIVYALMILAPVAAEKYGLL